MSDVITLTTGQSETIYGTWANAIAYLTMQLGPQYTAFLALASDDLRKKSLASAKRYIERFPWDPTLAGSFAVRDAIADGNGLLVFSTAQYELAALVAQKPKALSTLETGSNIKSVGGSGVPSVTNFRPTSVQLGTSYPLPDVAMQLIGKYLTSVNDVDTNYGQSGNCESAFDFEHRFSTFRPE